jgi:HSP20 family molecular chaperone IbpA
MMNKAATPGTEVARVEERASRTGRNTIAPDVDIYEDSTGMTLLADMPGVSKEGLDIKLEANHLFIQGQASIPSTQGLKLIHAEMPEPAYRRAFALGREFDRANINANLKNGVLTLRIPRLQEAQPRRIEVQAD